MCCFRASCVVPVQTPMDLYFFTSLKCLVDVKNFPMRGSGGATASKKDSHVIFPFITVLGDFCGKFTTQ